jgi:hypothetical protein
MNTFQLSPLGATAPPTAPPGKPAVVADASAPSSKKPFKPEIVAPDTGTGAPSTDQQLAEARSHTVQATEEHKAQVEKVQAEKAQAAKEKAAEARKAQEEAVTLDIGTLDRKIGLVEGTTKVFVDLVDPVHQRSVFRVFGPSEAAKDDSAEQPPADAPRPAPAEANNAYTRIAGTPPHKDLGVA